MKKRHHFLPTSIKPLYIKKYILFAQVSLNDQASHPDLVDQALLETQWDLESQRILKERKMDS